MTRSGWFKDVPDQTGFRTLEEQVAALRPAIAECKGKTLLDLGSAEGLISREFARAGAKHVTAIESVPGHVMAGEKICAGLPVKFELADLNNAAQMVYRADIVLCLGIAHKLKDPSICVKFAADSCTDLLLMRSGRAVDENGIITSKFLSEALVSGEEMRRVTCNSHAILRERGFVLERVEMGPPPHSEAVQYWRKRK